MYLCNLTQTHRDEYKHLFPPRYIQGNESGQDPWLSEQLTSHVGGKLLIITDVQVLSKFHTNTHNSIFSKKQTSMAGEFREKEFFSA